MQTRPSFVASVSAGVASLANKEFQMIVTSAPRLSLVVTKNDIAGESVPAGGSYTIDLFSPAGTYGRLQSIYISLPAASVSGATTGNLETVIAPSTLSGGYMSAKTSFNKTVEFNRFCFRQGGDVEQSPPNDYAAMTQAIKDSFFDENTALRFILNNNTDVAYTANFSFYINWVKSDVAPNS